MKRNKYSDLEEMEIDVLRELGNIGTGNALTSLSKMCQHPIDIAIPLIRIVPYQQAPTLLGGAETVQIGIMIEIDDGLKGTFMFLLSEEFTARLLQLLFEEDIKSLHEEEYTSAISEIGNIMCCSYINALSAMLGVNIQVSIPAVCCDMIGAILSVVMIKFANLGDEMLFIENRFSFDGEDYISHILFLPEPQSLDFMLTTLGLPYE